MVLALTGVQIEKIYCVIESAVAVRTFLAGTPLPSSPSSSAGDRLDSLMQGYFDLFSKMRGGRHPFLARYATLIQSQWKPDQASSIDLGVDEEQSMFDPTI